MKTCCFLIAMVLLLMAAPSLAGAQAMRFAGPYPIDQQPGETLAAAIHRAQRMERLRLPNGVSPAPRQDTAATPRVAPPSIISGKILTPTINVLKAPATPKIQFKFSSPGYLYYAQFTFLSQTSGQSFYTEFYCPFAAETGGEVTTEFGIYDEILDLLSVYTAPGQWILDYAILQDDSGNTVVVDRTQLATLFPSLTLNVINSGTPDSAAPTVSAGKLLTPTVHLSSAFPVFEAQLTVADNLSGVYFDGNTRVTMIAPDGKTYYYAWPNIPAPLLHGTITDGLNFAYVPNPPTGTWTIFDYWVCDVAKNCLVDETPSDIQALFGTTTFTVTQ